MERKGQGALEYLLLIGGAILVAVIVISILVGITGSGKSEAQLSTVDALCAKYPSGAVAAANCVGAPDQLSSGTTICGNNIADAITACTTSATLRCTVKRADCVTT